MAEVFRSVNGKKLEKYIAQRDEVQDELDRVLFKAEVRAEEHLARVRASIGYTGDHHIEIETKRGDVDRYLILSDEAGQRAAMSIEYGRQAYEVEREDGTTYRVEGMEGLGILHKALRARLGSLRGTGGGVLT